MSVPQLSASKLFDGSFGESERTSFPVSGVRILGSLYLYLVQAATSHIVKLLPYESRARTTMVVRCVRVISWYVRGAPQ